MWEPAELRRCHDHRTTQETTTQDTTQDGGAADREDVRRAQSGDRDAYARLVARHGAAATRLAAWLGAGPDTDDVVQEAFVNAWRSLPRFRGDAPFQPWLLRIVANQTRNTVRSRHRRHALALRSLRLDDPVDPVDPPGAAETVERQEALLAAVRSLRPGQRDVMVCRWFLGLSEAETARTLGIAPGTAKSRASRALHSLEVSVPELLGDPQQVRVADSGRVLSMSWWDGEVVLDQFAGALGPVFDKEIGSLGLLEVDLDGIRGGWIPGPHDLVYVDPEGDAVTVTARLAGRTLIWESAGVTFRLEGEDLTRREAERIAESLTGTF